MKLRWWKRETERKIHRKYYAWIESFWWSTLMRGCCSGTMMTMKMIVGVYYVNYMVTATGCYSHTHVQRTRHQPSNCIVFKIRGLRSVWQSDRQTPTVCVMKINCESRWINCALLTNKINYYDWIKEHTRVAYRMPGVCARLTIDSELKGWRLSLSLFFHFLCDSLQFSLSSFSHFVLSRVIHVRLVKQ